MRNAVVFGVVLAFAALAFLGLVGAGTGLWFTLPENPGWLDGNLWWVAVTAGTGVLVGVLRHFTRLPAELPGTVKELQEQRGSRCRSAHLRPRRAKPSAAVSACG